MKFYIFFYMYLCTVFSEPLKNVTTPNNSSFLKSARRILKGNEAGNTRSYMVYLRPTETDQKLVNWLCGGVIIHERYILTSAACIEDVKHFYVVSGTHQWKPVRDIDDCIKNGAKKAIRKCVVKSYDFDGYKFDNIRWMISDIAVVEVEDHFNFQRRVRGCDFIPSKIAFNNQSDEFEKAGTVASIAGWGSTNRFGDNMARVSSINSPELLETDVILITKKNCKKHWEERYHYIIDDYMICARDGAESSNLRICEGNEVFCKELYSKETIDIERRMLAPEKEQLVEKETVNKTAQLNETRRTAEFFAGGFCENDHGGPLIVGHGRTSLVIGVISACLTKEKSNLCYGPFLFSSVWRHRDLINCAINKEHEATCRRLLKSTNTHLSETIFNWSNHPSGKIKLRSHGSEEHVINTKIKVTNNVQLKAKKVPKFTTRDHLK